MESEIQQRLEAQQYCEAFDLLVNQFKDKVFRLAYSMARNETQAEDIVQEVFVRVWKALPRFQGGSSLSTWIYAITRNTCLTEIKRCSAHPTVSLQTPEIADALEGIPALTGSDLELGLAMDAQTLLAELPENYRQVITLFYLEQRAYEEVAVMLGIPLGTVKTNLFRAKRELLRIASRRSPMMMET